MTTFAFPVLSVIGPSKFAFGQKSSTMVHLSPLSGNVQSVEMPGARWYASLNFVNLADPDKGLLEAFLASLRGQANRFTLWDLVKPVPQGTMRGTMTTSGAIAQGAVSCTITAGSGQSGTTLKRGDKLNIAGELKMLVGASDYTCDGTGTCTVTVEPPFRLGYASAQAVAWNQPTALFMLTKPQWQADVSGGSNWANYAIDVVESFT